MDGRGRADGRRRAGRLVVEGAHHRRLGATPSASARDGRAAHSPDRRNAPRWLARLQRAGSRRDLPARPSTPVTAVTRVIAPNPGPYTGPGTNTWILDAGSVAVVIDPGPDDASHLAAINRALAGATVGVVLVTHSHPDHLPLADQVAGPHHASVRRYPELGDGDVVRAGR